jgi:hypothetical protein
MLVSQTSSDVTLCMMRWTELSLQRSSRKWECPTEKHNIWPGPANPVLMLGFQAECVIKLTSFATTSVSSTKYCLHHKSQPEGVRSNGNLNFYHLKFPPLALCTKPDVYNTGAWQVWEIPNLKVFSLGSWNSNSMQKVLNESCWRLLSFSHLFLLVKARIFLPYQPFCNISYRVSFWPCQSLLTILNKTG